MESGTYAYVCLFRSETQKPRYGMEDFNRKWNQVYLVPVG